VQGAGKADSSHAIIYKQEKEERFSLSNLEIERLDKSLYYDSAQH
jgi:hypothetical protein